MKNQLFEINTQKYGDGAQTLCTKGIALLILLFNFYSLQAQSNKNYLQVNTSNHVDTALEQMPKYPNGLNGVYFFIAENTVYPKKAIRKNIQGQVIIGFTVNKDGSLTDFKVMKSVHPLLDKEALRVVKSMTEWKPGTMKGKPVKVRMVQPINFKLPD